MMQNVVPHTKSTLRNVLFGGGGADKVLCGTGRLEIHKTLFHISKLSSQISSPWYCKNF